MRDPVRLIMVTDQNNNKFYNMDDNGNGTFTVTYGRVGTDGTTKIYDIGDWTKIYNSKTKKGYKDVSDLKITKQSVGIQPISDSEIDSLLNELYAKSRQFSAQYYNIEAAISTRQIDEAQNKLNLMAKNIDDVTSPPDYLLRQFNTLLIDVFTILPRKMKNVNSEKCHDLKDRPRILNREQSLLDNLALHAITPQANSSNTDQTFFDMYEFNMTKASQEEIDMVKERLQKESGATLSRMWVCRKPSRDAAMEDFLKNNGLKNNKKNVKLYWHGSGVENIFSIAATGLQIRPTNVSYSGSAFGDGIYSGPKSNKSLNYTNSDYVNGKRVKYLFLNAVVMGNQFDVNSNTDRLGNIRICDLDHNKFSQYNLGYHSVYAHASSSSYIRRDEAIVYNSEQVAARYLVEVFA